MTRSLPNILFFFPDQHRGDWMKQTGQAGVRMPNVDRLAARGTYYSSAITPSPVCSPARACLSTGMEYDNQDVLLNSHDLATDVPNVYRTLRDGGYWTMACGKFDLLKASKDWGADGLHRTADGRSMVHEFGFCDGIDSAGKRDFVTAHRLGRPEPYQQFLADRGLLDVHLDDFAKRTVDRNDTYTYTAPTPLPDDAYCDNWIADNGFELLDRRDSTRPWFLQVNFNGPHEPVDVTTEMWERSRDLDVEPARDSDMDPRVSIEMRRNYAAMLANIDRHVGRYLSWLEKTGQIENTIVVYSSDHGDQLGDRNRFHKMTPFEESIRIPLVVAGPGVSRQVCHGPVSLVDLTASLCDWGETKMPGRIDGIPLSHVSGGERVTGLVCWRVLRGERFKYVHNFSSDMSWPDMAALAWNPSVDAPHLLFDLMADPHEKHDISQREPDLCRRMATELLRRVAA